MTTMCRNPPLKKVKRGAYVCVCFVAGCFGWGVFEAKVSKPMLDETVDVL